MSGSQCSISWCRVETRGAICHDLELSYNYPPHPPTRGKKRKFIFLFLNKNNKTNKKNLHTCEPDRKDAASSQDLGSAVCVAVQPVSAGSSEKGFPMPFNMQLLQRVHHMRRVLQHPADCPQRDHFIVSKTLSVSFLKTITIISMRCVCSGRSVCAIRSLIKNRVIPCMLRSL